MAEHRFTRDFRLLSPADFKSVFDGAQHKVSCRYILMLAIKQQTPQTRLGMVVAKKNVSKSVERNRIKRLIRESFRHARLQLPGLDIIVLIRKGLDNLPNFVISSKIDALWKDLHTKAIKESGSGAQVN